jgi:multidrug/hemolysin transport system ATP-binding protein
LLKVKEIMDKRKIEYKVSGNHVLVNVESTMLARPLIDLCEAHISGFEVTSGSMDEVFINITGREIRE